MVESDEGDNILKYTLLEWLCMECNYLLGVGRPKPSDEKFEEIIQKKLWAGSVDGQIKKMKELWRFFDETTGAPEWLTFEQINKYETRLLNLLEERKKWYLELEERERLALLDLKKKGYVPDSMWEGGKDWLGIYARPIGTPRYGTDPYDENDDPPDGIDYAEWFEWYKKDFEELSKMYPE